MLASTTTPCETGDRICDAVFDWTDNSTAAEVADLVVGAPLAIVGLTVLGLVIRWILHKLVDRLTRRAAVGVLPDRVNHGSTTRRVQRAKTMGGLLKSIITGIVAGVITTMVLSEIGVNIAPIIASAGILGLALGFGAQSLVSDFLSGIFMMIEDQYGVGDEIDLGEAVGTVEAVSLRVTRLRDINGTVWYVRNGEIMRVGNMSQNWARTVLDISVAYHEDIARVRRVLTEVAHDLWEDEDFRSSASTASRSGSRSRRRHWSSGRSPGRCANESRGASTTRASRCPSRSGSSGTGRTRPHRPRSRSATRSRASRGQASDASSVIVVPASAWLTGQPALARPADSAIEKQDEWAAAISSSGLVLPFASSARAGHETSKVPTPDDFISTRPDPCAREPCQVVCAVRAVAIARQSGTPMTSL
jgi:small conductance mechanosensitive channel